ATTSPKPVCDSHATLRRRFFFQHSLPPRLLHSFPTRRSSDLHRRDRRCPVGRAECTTPARVCDGAGSAERRLPRGAAEPAPSQTDRKSTRLNSSHVSISYAVFCLKKKNNSVSRRLLPPSGPQL